MHFIQQGKGWISKSAIAPFLQRVLRRQENEADHAIGKETAPPRGKPLRRCMAKVEYLACENKILHLLAQGFSKKVVHERLIEDGTISMSYATFAKLIQKAKQDNSTTDISTPPIDPSTLF